MPLIFDDKNDYEDISKGDILSIDNISKVIFDEKITVNNLTKNKTFIVKNSLTKRQSEIILKGGLLNYVTGK
jgi:aconitate hydratase